MSISTQEHIEDIESKIDWISACQIALSGEIAKVDPLRKQLQELEIKKDALVGVLRNLENLRSLEPDMKEILNPVDPFGDAG